MTVPKEKARAEALRVAVVAIRRRGAREQALPTQTIGVVVV